MRALPRAPTRLATRSHNLIAMSKRPRSETDETNKYKSALDNLADEFICPITSELPLDPVTAEDGRVCEQRHSGMVRKRAEDARQESNHERADGQTAVPRRAGAEQHQDDGGERCSLRREGRCVEEAARGGAEGNRHAKEGGGWRCEAMHNLGLWHRDGKMGLAKDEKKAFKWFEKAADLGHVQSMGICGQFYLKGIGVEKNIAHGLVLLTQAANLGSQHSCYLLGLDVRDREIINTPAIPKEAAKWFGRMDECTFKNCPLESRCKAGEWLLKYEGK